MARAYSLDLRERVVASVANGQPCRAVAASFAVSVASVVKWSLRARATGSAAAKPMGGHRRFLLAEQRVNAGVILQHFSGAKVQQWCKQKGPRSGAFLLVAF